MSDTTDPRAMVERLKAFAEGCRGSMWQSRDETITLLDQSDDALTAALDENERLREAAEVSAIIANGALDPTAREACLRRDLSRVRDHLRAALKGSDQ